MGEAAAVLPVQQIMADVAPRLLSAGGIHSVFKLRNNVSLGALSRQLPRRLMSCSMRRATAAGDIHGWDTGYPISLYIGATTVEASGIERMS